MPFTFSHPAIVLPIKSALGNRVSLIGLVIGSLTPDFEYFLRMRIYSEYSHTLLGALWFDLPLGIVLCFIFHGIIKQPLIDNSPQCIQARLPALKQIDWNTYFRAHWLIVCLSILIGAYSHILWDSFTHPHAFFSDYFGLQRPLFSSDITIFKFLQHSSTFIGALVIAVYFFNIKPISTAFTKPNWQFWLSTIAMASFILSIRVGMGLHWTQYGNMIVSAIASGLLSLTVVCLWFQINNHYLR